MSLLPSTTVQAAHGNGAGHPPSRQAISQEVEKMTGMLWYQVLSALNDTSLQGDSLGPGGSEFQGMFLWNVAQNDFGSLDGQLVQSALRQYGEAAPLPQPPSSVSQILAADLPSSGAQSAQLQSMQSQAGGLEQVGPAAPLAGAGGAADLVTQAKRFAKQIWPEVENAATHLGVSPVGILAQAALETGWGASAPGNNLFGVKAAPGQASTTRQTNEMIDGVLTAVAAPFKTYASVADSVADYVQRVIENFPGAAGQGTVSGFASALQQSGYATDSSYAAKIVSVSQSPMMTQVLQSLGALTAAGNSPTNAASDQAGKL